MTASDNQFSREFTSEEVLELETKVRTGDLTSMTLLTADALRFHLQNPDILERRKELVLASNNGADRNVLRNVAIIAAHLNDTYTTDLIIEFLLLREDLSTAAYVGSILSRSKEEHSRNRGLVYLQLADKEGHLWSKGKLIREKYHKYGLLGKLVWVLYFPVYMVKFVYLKMRISDDPRVKND